MVEHKIIYHYKFNKINTILGLKAFFTTNQLSTIDKIYNSLALGTSPIVRALFDPEGGMKSVRDLDSLSFSDWFMSHGGSRSSIERMWDPIGNY